jgi:hypothetical protein
MRFDPVRSVYRDCRWCGGKGCLACESEANKAYGREFPEGPVPLATFSIDEIDKAEEAIGAEALTKAFGPGGGGIAEIIANITKVKQSAGEKDHEE